MNYLKDKDLFLRNKTHHGIVLNVSSNGFNRGSVAFGSVFINNHDSNDIFLFYSGAQDTLWSHSAIGLAVSDDMYRFKNVSSTPILEGDAQSFCYKEALTPTVIRVGNRFYMIFSGAQSRETSRRIGIAYADDPKGPWRILGEMLKPTRLWEGMHVDNGPSLVKLDEATFLIFYSNVTTPSKFDIFTLLRRYPIRRIGIAKVRIRGPTLSQIEVYKHPGNPLKHLNGAKGYWNESVFCPGYFQPDEMHYMVPAASIYSQVPYRQCIGIASSNTPYFDKSHTYIEKLIDGPSEKSRIIPNIKGQICLDSPIPLFVEDKRRLFLYYSVADRADYAWKIALTTFDIV